jgi:aminoglycoside 6'-N-acetyltransferase
VEVRFRPLAREDLGLLATWLAAPHVERWWREDPDPVAVEISYGPAIDGTDAAEIFVVEHDGRAIGLIQRYLIRDHPEWQQTLAPVAPAAALRHAASIDYLIGDESLIGRGIGTAFIRLFVADLWLRYPEVATLIVTVQQGNRRSWRALEKAGFRRVWSGQLESDDPSDEGPSYGYRLDRPPRPPDPRPARTVSRHDGIASGPCPTTSPARSPTSSST